MTKFAGDISTASVPKIENFDLPDDTGDFSSFKELPNDLGAKQPFKLTEVQKQSEIYQKVISGKIKLADTQQKGNFGEIAADICMAEKGYIRLGDNRVTDLDQPGHDGIDGVYWNPWKNPPFVIVDAKYNTAQLAETKDGKQMSVSWIDARLDPAVGKERADEIRMAILEGQVGRYIIRIGKDDDVTASPVFERLDGNGNVVAKGDDLDVA